MEAFVVITTCPAETATEIARQLVQERLAACVNILPSIQSIYRWHNDAVEEAKESMLFIKTTQACYAALEKAITALHPYEVPEVLALPLTQSSSSYLNWLLNSCTSQKTL